VERREAMRFRTTTASPAVPAAKQDKVRLAALHAPRFRGKMKSSPSATREINLAWLFEN